MITTTASADVWTYKDEFFTELKAQVPKILATQNPANGQMGKGIWTVRDQEPMFALAVAWATDKPGNEYFHQAKLLDAIMLAGDALAEDQDPTGQWTFRKEDGSTWGQIYMPWTYSRWAQTFMLIKDAMPAERRAKWEKALTLGYTSIAAHELKTIHNIPTHQARGLYIAGNALDRPEWCAEATAFMKRVCDAQDKAGFWSENVGPVVGYNFVYADAIGVYYAASHDETVLPALERAAKYHANFTYPDGTSVETIDERQVYEPNVVMPNVGFSFTAVGRGYAKAQLARRREMKQPLAADVLAAYVQFGDEGEATPPAAVKDEASFVLGDNDAMTRRVKPWFTCLSAYHAAVPTTRWIQDRQNLVSLFNDDVGLILGGGNTKLQPLWSTFTVGDVSLMKHKPGDEDPNFTPPAGLLHVPTNATIDPDHTTLHLEYGDVKTSVAVSLSPDVAKLTYACQSPTDKVVAAHIPLLPRMKTHWATASGKTGPLNDEPFIVAAGEAGDWFQLDNVRVSLPATATVEWPVLPHNQYRKDGHAAPHEGRIVVSIPLTENAMSQTISVQVVSK